MLEKKNQLKQICNKKINSTKKINMKKMKLQLLKI
jgi:hypothetical protein